MLISIHALLAESDVFSFCFSVFDFLFLSTLSLRRATVEEVSGDTWARDFYPRSPCGERLDDSSLTSLADVISIHALLAESDVYSSAPSRYSLTFLSTLSLRRATFQFLTLRFRFFISIHALLAESDYFTLPVLFRKLLFLSTLSLRRATYVSYN